MRPRATLVRLGAIWLALRAAIALGLSAPLPGTVGRALAGTPSGEAALAEPGGVVLVEVVRKLPEAGVGLGAAPWWIVVGVVLTLVPWGATAFALAHPQALAGEALSHAVRRAARMLLITGAGWVLIGALGVAASLSVSQVASGFDEGTEARVVGTVALGALGLIPIALASIFVETLRVLGVLGSASFHHDLGVGVRVMRRAGLRLLARWAWVALVGAALTVSGLALGVRAFAGGGAAWLGGLSAGVIAVALVALRMSMLAAVVRACVAEAPVAEIARDAPGMSSVEG